MKMNRYTILFFILLSFALSTVYGDDIDTLIAKAKADPTDASILAQLARECKKQKQYGNTIRLYQRCIELVPTEAKYYTALASTYNGIEAPAKAETVLRAGISNIVNPLPLIKQLAATLYKLGKYNEAITNYHKAIAVRKNPKPSTRLYVGLAKCYRDVAEYGKSDVYFKKALMIKQNAWTYYDYAKLYLKQDNYPKAIEVFKKALSIAKYHKTCTTIANKTASVIFDYASQLKEQGRTDKAISYLKMILDIKSLADTPSGNRARFWIERW